jgi:hypothetical protein
MEKIATVPILKMANRAHLRAFSEVSEFVIHQRISTYFKSKLSSSRHGVTKPKPTTMDLVTLTIIITPFVCSRRKFDSICFDLSFAILALSELRTYGLPIGYADWFVGQLTNRTCYFRNSEFLRRPVLLLLHRQNINSRAIPFLRSFCQIASGFHFGFRNNIFFYRAMSSALGRTPNLEGQVSVFMSPNDRVAQLYPQTPGFLFVTFLESHGYGGGILTRLHKGYSYSRFCFETFIFQYTHSWLM